MIANNRNTHVFKGHKTLLSGKFVTYGEVELQTRYDIFNKSKNFEWGDHSDGSVQLSFAMLYQLTDNIEFAKEYSALFTNEVIRDLGRDWILNGSDVAVWIQNHETETKEEIKKPTLQNTKPIKKSKPKTNVVKKVCAELHITQKNLALILEVPEGTVSSWAVKNEIPRLGKKAIQFYIEKQKNQQIVDSYKSFVHLLNVS